MNPNRLLAEKILNDKEISGPEIFVGQVYSLSGDPRLIARTIPLGERYLIALQIILSILSVTGAPSLPIVETKKPVEKAPPVTPTQPSEETIPDFYAVLGVNPTASKEEIKKAHRELIRKYHPDVFAGQGLSDAEMAEVKSYAQEINLAYLTLSKDKNREEYDNLRTMFSTAPSKKPPKAPGVVGTAATGLAKKGVKKALVKTGAKVAAKLGLREVVSDVAAALTAASGPLAVVIGPLVKALTWVATWLAEKVIGRIAKWIRENKEAALLAAILGAGLLTGSPLLLTGGLAFGAVFFFSTLILPAIVMAVGVIAGSFIFIIFLVAIILFIINSGAYIVPPSPFGIAYLQESQYIGVEKTASPTKVDNPPPSRTITYTVKITAKQGTLTNISFSDDCKVLRAGGTSNCPATTIPPPPTLVSPTQPFSFSYQRTYGTQYTDSVATDTLTVTADAPGAPGETSTGTSSVIIGTPPTSCFEFEPTSAPYMSEFLAAAVELSSKAAYAAKLCAAGPITVRLNTSGPVATGACAGASANSMFFNNCLYFQTHGQAFITYLFAHESGHTYSHRTGELSQFVTQGISSEGYLPTYCISGNASVYEDFAETIGDYIDNGRLRPLCAHNDQRPFRLCESQFVRHCDFARNVIFNE